MVIAERNGETSYTTNRRSRTLNSNISPINNNSSNNESCSSDINSDSDTEQSVRVGNEYQAEIPDYCLSKPAPPNYPEKALLVWTPINGIDEDKLNDYLSISAEKYNYNCEQALGMLYWHKFNFELALADLANFLPFPDEWSMEDKALFEQAYQFHNKNFHKINQLLPDKKLSSLVKFYYTWKKVKSRNSYVDKQVKKSNSQTKDDSTTDSATNDAMGDSDNEFEANALNSSSLKDQQLQERNECCVCFTRTSSQFYNTKFGLLCRVCYNSKRKNVSIKQPNINIPEDNLIKTSNNASNSKADMFRLPKSLTPMLLDETILKEISKEHETSTTSKVLTTLDEEISETTRKIRNLKQENFNKKLEITELGDFSLLNQNNNRIISRWTNDEMILIVHAIREFGKDFKTIAEIIGTKTESHIKNYYLQNQNKMKFDAILDEYNEENDFDSDKICRQDENEDTKTRSKSLK